MNSTGRAIVIGSGFGGIASALRARAKGLHVTLVERLDTLGGRAQAFEKDGFKHDAGPTVITAPFLFDELFELFGKSRLTIISKLSSKRGTTSYSRMRESSAIEGISNTRTQRLQNSSLTTFLATKSCWLCRKQFLKLASNNSLRSRSLPR